MHLKRMLRATGVIVISSLSSAAAAQTATLVGMVINIETKRPLADVVVSATSPALQGEQVVVTDAEGKYRIPELPPGVYTLRFDKEAFKPHGRLEVTMRSDRTVRVNVELLPEEYTETISVLDCGPILDAGSSSTELSVEQEHIRRLAINPPRAGAVRPAPSRASPSWSRGWKALRMACPSTGPALSRTPTWWTGSPSRIRCPVSTPCR